ncbi:MAG: SufD family Fe-S cluster assembly protein [Oscillospiraceae bacterium]|jgi:Fe-S cluster assembly scaffold protein SufB|nr:SufD family Fe-S cluster assembly protein [Oscillospiraceae bacterium]
MHLKTKINSLPVQTFSRLLVNGSEHDIIVPKRQKQAANITKLPAGVLHAHESVLKCAEFSSAMSEELAVLIQANASAGLSFRVPKGAAVRLPIEQEFDAATTPVVSNVIYAEAGARVSVLLVYTGKAETAFFSTRVLAENCAEVSVTEVFLSDGAVYGDFQSVLGNSASLRHNRIVMGMGSRYLGSFNRLSGSDCEAKSEIFYLCSDGVCDFNCINRHFAANSKSELLASGVLLGDAEKTFRGTLDFQPGSRGSVGAESENVLILSDDAKNRSCPLVLCGEEDVDGSHSVSVGKIDAAKLYYMQTRGLSEAETKTLVSLGMLQSALSSVANEKLEEKLKETARAKIICA